MEITKCDICKKIENERSNRNDKWIMGHIIAKKSIRFDLCEKCSMKFMRYLKKYLKIKK